MESMDSLRAILTKSTRSSGTDKTAPSEQSQTPVSSSKPSNATPAVAIPSRPSRSKSELQYPMLYVPSSSFKSATSTPPSHSSAKYGSFFKSFRGRSAFDADDDEFDSGRKYSTATLKAKKHVTISSPDDKVVMPNPPSRLRRGSFFKSYRGRSAFDVDDDEFDSAQKYSIASITKDGAVTPAIEPWKTRSRRSVSPYPLPYTSPTSKLRGRDLFASFSGRSPFDADDDEFDTARKYTIEESSAVPTTRARKISWADQAANPASSDLASEQAALGSKDDDGSSADKSGSTLSFTSTFDSASVLAPPVPAARPQGYKTIRKAEGKLMSATLASARSISPYKGNMWDPEEEEWGDASKVVETFKASYKTPAPRSPTKAGALSYFGTAIQSTVKSALSSPTKKAKDEEMRLEEEVWEKVEELVNPYYWNPEGDTVDDVMRGVFLSSTRFFPSQQPDSPRNTHLIDLGAYFESTDPLVSSARPRLCDAIGTVLSHTSKECLEAFLDPSTKEFIYRRKVDSNEGGLILIIRREGNEVVCGTYHNFAFKKLWKLYVKSIISVTGQWHEVFATAKPGEMIINKGTPEWGTIQPETPVVKSGESCSMMVENTQRKLELSPVKKAAKTSDDVYETNPKFMLCQSRVLATHLL